MKEYSVDRELDELDKAILRELQMDSRMSNVEVANRVNLSPPAIHARIRRLEQLGFIRQYVTLVDREKIGYDMLCFVSVTLQLHQPDQVQSFRSLILQMPEVLECHLVTGDFDYLLKVVVRNREQLHDFLMERLTAMPGIARFHTNLVLNEIKSTTALPLD